MFPCLRLRGYGSFIPLGVTIIFYRQTTQYEGSALNLHVGNIGLCFFWIRLCLGSYYLHGSKDARPLKDDL